MAVTLESRPAEVEDRWWQAVQERDTRMAGSFIIGVKSTGIFCRPGCPARTPRRENVSFFSNPAEAAAAGFRPCLRCHPTELHRLDAQVVQTARQLFDISDGFPGTAALATAAGVSEHALRSAFQRVLGVTPRGAWEAASLERARDLLRDGADVTTAIYESGFGSSRGFYEAAGKGLGMAPATYRKHGAGERISYTIVPAAIGDVLVATTERGLCAVRLGQSEELERDFRAEFAAAEFQQDAPGLAATAEAVVRAIDGDLAGLELPLDLRGTAFQMRVWAALCAVPRGETRTYREVAEAIGEPRAARAVARACASNRVAVIVPCHRVVASGGEPGGYRWGVERKRELLAREREHAGT